LAARHCLSPRKIRNLCLSCLQDSELCVLDRSHVIHRHWPRISADRRRCRHRHVRIRSIGAAAYWHSLHSMLGGVYVTVRCPSVRLSVPFARCSSVRRSSTGPQQCAQQQMQVVPRLQLSWEAEYRLVNTVQCVLGKKKIKCVKKLKQYEHEIHLSQFCSLAVLDPRVGHTIDVFSPFIFLLCHSD